MKRVVELIVLVVSVFAFCPDPVWANCLAASVVLLLLQRVAESLRSHSVVTEWAASHFLPAAAALGALGVTLVLWRPSMRIEYAIWTAVIPLASWALTVDSGKRGAQWWLTFVGCGLVLLGTTFLHWLSLLSSDPPVQLVYSGVLLFPLAIAIQFLDRLLPARYVHHAPATPVAS